VRTASPRPEQRHRSAGARRGLHVRRGRPDTDVVFVDASGRRRRLFVAAGVAGGTVLILLTLALLAGFTGVGRANVPGWPGSVPHEAQGGTGAPDAAPSPRSSGQAVPSATPSGPSATALPSASPSPSKRRGSPAHPSTHPTGKK